MKIIAPVFVVLSGVLLASCGTYSVSDVQPVAGAPAGATAEQLPPKAPETVIVTENDISDRPYRALGDITVTVRKIHLLAADPTREKVTEALREKAAEMGADAVVLARYGSVGISMMSWGEMEGNGRAVVFQK